MRVEAESTSSHVAAIVAFEASGLRASSFRNGLRCKRLQERFVCGHAGVLYHFACLKSHPKSHLGVSTLLP